MYYTVSVQHSFRDSLILTMKLLSGLLSIRFTAGNSQMCQYKCTILMTPNSPSLPPVLVNEKYDNYIFKEITGWSDSVNRV